MVAFKWIVGTSDEVTTCECCGKSDLKSTVVLGTHDGEVSYYGIVCAARHLDRRVTQAFAFRSNFGKYHVVSRTGEHVAAFGVGSYATVRDAARAVDLASKGWRIVRHESDLTAPIGGAS